MGFLDLFRGPDYDAIEEIKLQQNQLVYTGFTDRQTAIKKTKVGDLLTFKRSRRDGNVYYSVTNLRTGQLLGEISYGTSEWLYKNYKDARLLGKVTEKVSGTVCSPNTVDIEYKIYK